MAQARDLDAAEAPVVPTVPPPPTNPSHSPSWPLHVRALLLKNLRLKLRHPFGTCAEVLVPFVFMVGVVIVWSVVDPSDAGAENFIASNNVSAVDVVEPWTLLQEYTCTRSNLTIAGIRPCNVTDETSVDGFECLAAQLIDAPYALCVTGTSASALLRRNWQAFARPRRVPSLDEVVMWKWIAAATVPWLERLDYGSHKAAATQGSRLMFLDDGVSGYAAAFRDYINATSSLFNLIFDGTWTDIKTVMDRTIASDYVGRAMAVIHLEHLSAEGIQVTMYVNRSGAPTTTPVYSRIGSQGIGEFRLRNWHVGGELTLQSLITDFYLRHFQNDTAWDARPEAAEMLTANRVATVPMPHVAYHSNSFYGYVGGMMSIVAVLAYLFPVSQLTKRIVQEKESRLRESMMIMGLGRGSFYASWFVTYLVTHFLTALIIAILLKTTALPKADFGVILFLFFLFGASTVPLSGALSTIFSQSRTAALVGPALFFLMSLPSFALQADTPASVLVPLCVIFAPVGFATGARMLFDYEVTVGLTAGQMNNKQDQVPIIQVFVFLGVAFVWYTLLMLYLDAVLPSEWGVRRHPCFCILDAYWAWKRPASQNFDAPREFEFDGIPAAVIPNHAIMEAAMRRGRGGRQRPLDDDPESMFEPMEARKVLPTVRIERLKKSFGGVPAVDDLSFSLYPDEVTVLLGHNGAGKTTAVACMMGMLGMDDGDCVLYGESVKRDLARARRHIGFCPQHNILWDELTCLEHLVLYAQFKGIAPGKDSLAAAEEMLTAVDLSAKRDAPTLNLSGGQKRKLSVALAFIGRSKLVFLDEPTAGMDVGARRHTWDLIRRMSVGRTILLTTHFMDEADLLGNTIAIMSHGRLKCAGSAMFLKRRFGIGYRLTIGVAGGPDMQDRLLRDPIRKHVRGARRLHNMAAGELGVRLPMEEAHSFSNLLEQLEANLAVRSLSLGHTTLEEVFLRIALDDHEGAQEMATIAMNSKVVARIRGDDDQPLWKQEEMSFQDGPTPPSRQFMPLMTKRLWTVTRDTRTIILQIILPFVCVLFGVQLSQVRFFDNPPRISLRGDSYTGQTETPFTLCPYGLDAMPNQENSNAFFVNVSTAAAFSELLQAQYLGHGNRLRITAFACSVLTTAAANIFTPLLFSNESYPHAGLVALSDYHALTARYLTGNTALKWDIGLDVLPLDPYSETFAAAINGFMLSALVLIPFTFLPSSFIGFIVKEREYKSKHLQMVAGLRYSVYWLCNFVYDLLSYLVTMFLVVMLFFIYQKTEFVGTGETFAAIVLLLFFYGLASITGAYLASFLFAHHATAQNVVMFVNFVVGFFFTMLTFLLQITESTAAVGSGLKWVFRLHPAYCLGEGLGALAQLPLIEAFTDNRGPLAMNVVGWNIVYMAVEFPLYMVLVLIMDHPSRELRQHKLMDQKDEETEEEMIRNEDDDVHRERLAVENGSRDHQDVVLVKRMRKVFDANTRPQQDDDDGLGAPATNGTPAMGASGARAVHPHVNPLAAHPSTESLPDEPAGSPMTRPGAFRRVRVSKHQQAKDKLVAVRSLSFGVHDREVFAFLGTNGAGKTTAMNVITGAFPPTSGCASVVGHDCTDDASTARRYIGYCPQFDALTDLLTPVEHIKFYAALRGVPNESMSKVVDILITLCELADYRDVCAHALSGGNRRKLSVAISLIGGPRVVFLDEPSAGMDPVARRGLWTAIQRISRQCAVVLTTHHLEEVEALANRVAIMVDGELRVLGSLNHIKRKFGSGFEMAIRVRDNESEAKTKELVRVQLPTAELQELRNHRLSYSLPGDIVLSRIFSAIETAKQEGGCGILDYSLAQTSVESVFLRAQHGTLEQILAPEVLRHEPPPSTPSSAIRSQLVPEFQLPAARMIPPYEV
jgi:ATP-binding cassette subfamily A (ABC1) protein 3